MKRQEHYLNLLTLTRGQVTVSTVPYSCRRCRRNHVVIVVMVVVVCLRVIVVVVVVTVAKRRVWYEVVRWVKVAEREFDYFVRLDPAAVVELKTLQMYYLYNKSVTV